MVGRDPNPWMSRCSGELRNVKMKKIVKAASNNIVRSESDKNWFLQYENIRVGRPSKTEDMIVQDRAVAMPDFVDHPECQLNTDTLSTAQHTLLTPKEHHENVYPPQPSYKRPVGDQPSHVPPPGLDLCGAHPCGCGLLEGRPQGAQERPGDRHASGDVAQQPLRLEQRQD